MHARDGKLQKCMNHVKGTHQWWFVREVLYFMENKPHGKMIKNDTFFFNFIIIIIIFFTLQYCIGFATHQHASATGVHVFPILNPPSHLPSNTIPLGHLSAPAPSFLYPASNLEFFKWSGVLNLWICNIGIICRKNNPASQAAVWRHGKEAI